MNARVLAETLLTRVRLPTFRRAGLQNSSARPNALVGLKYLVPVRPGDTETRYTLVPTLLVPGSVVKFPRYLLPVCLVLWLPLASRANTFTFTNSSSTLENLAHGTAYTWGLDLTQMGLLESALHHGEHLDSATLTIYNIYDWKANEKDVLYVNLLNNLRSGVHSYTYNSAPSQNDTTYGSDFFNTASTHLQYQADVANSLLVYSGSYDDHGYTDTHNNFVAMPGTWGDPAGGRATNFNLVINLTPANLTVLNQFLATDYNHLSTTNDLGLGFGPDCHFFDKGVKLTVNVPDAGNTLALLVAGLAAIAGMITSGRRTRSPDQRCG